jgi:hypothetical protein
MMTVLLAHRILLVIDEFARVCAFQRTIPHGDLAGITALEITAGPTHALLRWQRAVLHRKRFRSCSCGFRDARLESSVMLGHLPTWTR